MFKSKINIKVRSKLGNRIEASRAVNYPFKSILIFIGSPGIELPPDHPIVISHIIDKFIRINQESKNLQESVILSLKYTPLNPPK